MRYAIVYCSSTGNTAMLAEALKAELGDQECVYCGIPDAQAYAADVIFAGFWTDKGTCQEDLKVFLKGLHEQQVFLFGTAGFGGDQSYFDRILANVNAVLPPETKLIGSFMCQGKMPLSVRERYEALQSQNKNMQAMIDNFDHASTHPDAKDLQKLKECIRKISY